MDIQWFLQMWPGLIDKAKEGGLDCIQTYVFWNMHEPEQGKVIDFKFNHVYVILLFTRLMLVFVIAV